MTVATIVSFEVEGEGKVDERKGWEEKGEMRDGEGIGLWESWKEGGERWVRFSLVKMDGPR